MATRRRKSMDDIVRQQRRLLLALGNNNGRYDPNKNPNRKAIVNAAADRYINRIEGMKSVGKLRNASARATQEAWSGNMDFSKADRLAIKADTRKFSQRTYMGLSNG